MDDLSEKLRVATEDFVTNIDQQIAFLDEEYAAFIKQIGSEKQTVELVKALIRQMDFCVANTLGLTISETDDVKEKVKLGLNEKREELDSLMQVYEANLAVKTEKKAILTDLKRYFDGLKSKKAQIKSDTANEELFGERLLMRHLGINFKITKSDSVVAVIYKNSSKNPKVEKLISVEKENAAIEDFWRTLNKLMNTAPAKKLQENVSITDSNKVIECTHLV